MPVIWKFEIPLPHYSGRVVSIPLPGLSRLLSVGEQAGGLYVWALCEDPLRPRDPWAFRVVMTGEQIPDDAVIGDFLGTVVFGLLVVHVFAHRQIGLV